MQNILTGGTDWAAEVDWSLDFEYDTNNQLMPFTFEIETFFSAEKEKNI